MKLVPVFQNGGDPNFNYDAALEAYNWAVENPEEAVIVAKSLAFDDIVELVDRNKVELQEAIDNEIHNRISETRDSIKRAAVSKAANGEEIDRLVALGEEISKADNYSADERRRNAMRQWRGPGGQFRTMTVKIQPAGTPGTIQTPFPDSQASAMRIPKAKELLPSQRLKFHNAYVQVAEALSTVQGLNADDVHVAYNYVDSDGNLAATKIKVDKAPDLSKEEFINNNTLDSVEVTVNPNLSAYGASYNIIDRMAGPNIAGNAVSIGGNFGGALQTYAKENKTTFSESDIGSRKQDFERLGAASKLIQTTLGDRIGPAGLIATSLGNWVGTHGPEAEKVLGPGARKAAYRFRGVEKRPDEKLQLAIDTEMKKIVRMLTKNGMSPRKAQAHARDYLIYGPESALGKYTADGRSKGKLEVNESPLVTELLKDLPSMELAQLQINSGHVPPSHGIIIDRKGTVVSQAVGYGDDWYLPFNLRTLNMVNGGEYLRTRMLGGPTSEDLYASLMSEARGFTVMSHSGIFNVEFDPTFRGSRRFNDKSKRMVDRYEKLLDAVQSKKVSPTVPESRMREIRAAAKDAWPGQIERQQTQIEYDIKNEKRYPTMSQEEMEKSKETWINSSYAPTRQTKDGRQMDYMELKEQYVNDYIVSEAKKPAQEEFDWNAAAADMATGDVGADTYGELNNQMAALQTSAKYQLASMGDASARSGKKDRASLMNEASAKFDADPISALAEKDPSITTKWESAQKQIQHAYSIEHQSMQLDSQGYYNALKALQEQFPYYIKRVEYRPIAGQGAYGGNEDTGYVKPRFNRPAAAKASYYDASILGRTKVRADKVQYQNSRINVSSSVNDDSSTSFESTRDASDPEIAERARRNNERAKKNEVIDSRWKLYQHLIAPNTHFIHGPLKDGGFGPVPIYIADPSGNGILQLTKAQLSVPTLTADLSTIHDELLKTGNSADAGIPQDRADLPPNHGATRSGPWTQAEFEHLMNTYPGFSRLLERDSLIARDNFRKQALPNMSSVNEAFLKAGKKAPEGDHLNLWDLDKATASKTSEFKFKEPEYLAGRNPESYKNTAKEVIKGSRRFIRPDTYSPASFEQNFADSSFASFVDTDIDTITNEYLKANEPDDMFSYEQLLQSLHRLRRLHSLYASKNLYSDTQTIENEKLSNEVDNALRAAAQKANESGN